MIRTIKYSYIKSREQFGLGGVLLFFLAGISIFLGIIVFAIFLLKISSSLSIISNNDSINYNATSMIGDFLSGAVGTLWSLAGVLLFFLALRLQSKELRLQIKELKDTREVFTIQQFENTFFSLLKTQQELRQSLECTEITDRSYYEVDPANYKSHLVFEYLKDYTIGNYNKIKSIYDKIVSIDNLKNKSADNLNIKRVRIAELNREYGIDDYTKLSNQLFFSKTVYKITFNNFHNQLGHYFRNLYHILSFLDENETRELAILGFHKFTKRNSGEIISIAINGEDLQEKRIISKYKRYSEFIQAQMSAAELFLLFYNGLFFEKTKALIHKYDFIENLSLDDLLNPELESKFYTNFKVGLKNYPDVTLKSTSEILKL